MNDSHRLYTSTAFYARILPLVRCLGLKSGEVEKCRRLQIDLLRGLLEEKDDPMYLLHCFVLAIASDALRGLEGKEQVWGLHYYDVTDEVGWLDRHLESWGVVVQGLDAKVMEFRSIAAASIEKYFLHVIDPEGNPDAGRADYEKLDLVLREIPHRNPDRETCDRFVFYFGNRYSEGLDEPRLLLRYFDEIGKGDAQTTLK